MKPRMIMAVGSHIGDMDLAARGETYGFRYIDYYTAQLTMRGCLARTDRAVALSSGDGRLYLSTGFSITRTFHVMRAQLDVPGDDEETRT